MVCCCRVFSVICIVAIAGYDYNVNHFLTPNCWLICCYLSKKCLTIRKMCVSMSAEQIAILGCAVTGALLARPGTLAICVNGIV